MSEPSAVHLTWTKRVAYRANPIRDILPLALLGIVLAVISPLIGYPLMSIAFLGLACIGCVHHLRPRMRLRIDGESVLLLQETPLRNGMIVLPVIFSLMAAAAVAQVVVGSREPDLRLVVIAAGLCCIAVLLGVIAVLVSGPVRISGATVTLFRGREFSIVDDSFAVTAMRRGPPVVTFSRDTGPRPRSVNLTSGQFGIDAETVAAALEHLRKWASHGRTGSAAEIAAMLSVAPPAGLAVEDSTVIEVVVSDKTGDSD